MNGEKECTEQGRHPAIDLAASEQLLKDRQTPLLRARRLLPLGGPRNWTLTRRASQEPACPLWSTLRLRA